MIVISEAGMNGRNVELMKVETFEDAKDYVHTLNPVCFEYDVDHKDCADAYLKDGRVLCIQPEGFKL